MRWKRGLPWLGILLTVAVWPAVAEESQTSEDLEELLVTAGRSPTPALELIGNSARLDAEAIRITRHQHIHELAVRLPGTWISRGSGQEHLTAIRSPVLTGPGSCGAFLTLEDGISTRPTGFCNVNQLFEIPTESAVATEVVRGPANALYGSNGLHGTINFLMPQPSLESAADAAVEVGPDDFLRGRLNVTGGLGNTALSAGIIGNTYDGFRDDSGYDQFKAYARSRWVSAVPCWIRKPPDSFSARMRTRTKNYALPIPTRRLTGMRTASVYTRASCPTRAVDSKTMNSPVGCVARTWIFCSIFFLGNRWRRTAR